MRVGRFSGFPFWYLNYNISSKELQEVFDTLVTVVLFGLYALKKCYVAGEIPNVFTIIR